MSTNEEKQACNELLNELANDLKLLHRDEKNRISLDESLRVIENLRTEIKLT